MWLYARVATPDPELLEGLASLGVGLREFADPETRLPHREAMALLQRQVERTGDKTLGLRAGSSFEHGDFDVLESAARSCSSLREAVLCISRYASLLNDACEITLSEEGDRAVWTFRLTDGVKHLPAGNDFAVACAVTFARMYADLPEGPLEVHFMHTEATKFRRVRARLRTRREARDAPQRVHLPAQHPGHAHAPRRISTRRSTRAQELVERLRVHQGVAGRVRDVVLSQLRGGESSMKSVARAMAMSPATLRRRLAAEGTTHTEILDRVRYELAQAYLTDSTLSTREVAFLLGYSHAKAFYEAFRRWTGGVAPADYRAQSAAP